MDQDRQAELLAESDEMVADIIQVSLKPGVSRDRADALKAARSLRLLAEAVEGDDDGPDPG